jgi:heptosyltransferase I
MSQSEEHQSILVVRLGALGDVANTLPTVFALRREFPGARIGWVVEEPSRDLVAASGVADRIILFPRKEIRRLMARPWKWHRAAGELLRFIREVRRERYCFLLDFQGNLKSGLMSVFSGARDRIGFAAGHCKEMNWLFNNVLAMPATKRLPRAEKYAALGQVIAPDLKPGPVELPPNAAAAAQVEEFLRTLTVGEESLAGVGARHALPLRGPTARVGPLVVLHPGTSAFGDFKRWPAERFGAVAAEMAMRRGARCVVTYGPAEQELAEQVVQASQGAAHLAPPLAIPGLIELLRRADLMIACDTGPLYIAALLRRPAVAIFGPKDPAIYAPYGTRCEIVRAGLACSPCTRRRCNKPKCMEQITVEMVIAAGERMIGE